MSNKQKPVTLARIQTAMKTVGIPDDLQANVAREWNAQLQALPTCKAKAIRDGWIGGYALVFSDATKANRNKCWFDYHRSSFPTVKSYSRMPILWEHGRGIKETCGLLSGLKKDQKGLQVTSARLDLSDPFGRKCWDMALKGQLYYSFGSLPEFCTPADDGCMEVFGIAELSVTKNPAGPTHQADYDSMANMIQRQNTAYKSAVRQTFIRNGIQEDSADAIISLLPEPY